MNTYMKPIKNIDVTDCLDILNDIKDDVRGIFALVSGLQDPNDPDSWSYGLIADLSYSIADTLENVVNCLENDEAARS